MHQKAVLPCTETWTSWRVGCRETWSSARASAGSCTWGGTTPCISTGLGRTCWRAALRRRTWECWWTTGWPWASSMPFLPRRLVGYWDALGGAWPSGQGRFSFPSALRYWGPIWSTASSSGLPTSRKMRSCWRESSEGLQRWWGDWSVCPMRKGWGSWACLAWGREGWEGIS